MARKAVPESTQNNVLLKSRRRCCLCFWLTGRDEVVKGQIAHLDQNYENPDEDNLVFLCYDHHDEYDSRTSTSKGLREGEVRRRRPAVPGDGVPVPHRPPPGIAVVGAQARARRHRRPLETAFPADEQRRDGNPGRDG